MMQHIAAFAQPSTAWQVESSSEEDESDDEDVVVAAPAANGKKVSTPALACCPTSMPVAASLGGRLHSCLLLHTSI